MKWNIVLFPALLCVMWSLHAQEPTAQPAAPVVQTAQEPVPQAAEKPLPAVKELLEQVERNEVNDEAIRKDYTYHVHLEEEYFDKNGKVKKTSITDSESLTVDGVRIDRVVARDGKALTAEEKKKEDERIDKIVAKARAHRAELQQKGKTTNANGQTVLTASRILELGTFSNERRIDLNGRPTIVLDYAGDPQAKTRDAFEGIVRDLVGTVWVDETDRVMVKAEGHFLKDFKIGIGLVANIHGGLNFSWTQEKINDEVWLPKEIEGEGSARILLFVKMNGRIKQQMSNYKKFRTGATIIPSYRLIGPDGNILPDKPAQETSPKP